MDFDRVRSEYSILTIMAKLGCDMTHKGYMYKAPFREDRTPSMHVDERRNMWCDYGSILPDGRRAGGGNIELVRLMFGLNSNKEAAEKIIDICGGLYESYEPPRTVKKESEKKPGIEIISSLNMITNRALRNYLRGRGINPDLANLWCDEVDFRIGASGKHMFAIGFHNDRNGYVLRNSFFKGTNVNSISTIVKDSPVVGEAWKDREFCHSHPDAGKGKVMVFEGFMDYLSLLTMRGVRKPECDCVVLNSTVNVGDAIGFLHRHNRIECWLDNDDAGRQCLEFIRDRFGEGKVTDMSPTYCRNNDLNEYLTQAIKGSELPHRSLGRGL